MAPARLLGPELRAGCGAAEPAPGSSSSVTFTGVARPPAPIASAATASSVRLAPGHEEAVPGAMQLEEGGRHLVRGRPRHRQRDVRASVLDVAAALDARLRGRDALPLELVHGRRLQLRQGGGHRGAAGLLERRLDAAFAQCPHVREAHAVGAEHAGERVQEHLRHPERVGDQAGVLACRAAEAAEHVVR